MKGRESGRYKIISAKGRTTKRSAGKGGREAEKIARISGERRESEIKK